MAPARLAARSALEPRVARPCCRQSSNSSLRFIAENSIHPPERFGSGSLLNRRLVGEQRGSGGGISAAGRDAVVGSTP